MKYCIHIISFNHNNSVMFGIGGKSLSRITFVPLNFKPCDYIVIYITINTIKIIKVKFIIFMTHYSSLHVLPAQKHTDVHKPLNSFPISSL